MDGNPDPAGLRSRTSEMPLENGSGSSPRRKAASSITFDGRRRPPLSSPYLPTPTERLVLLAFPALLALGTAFSFASPETRAAPFDAAAGAHSQDPALAPSYFARKDNVVNTLFVKRGWAWISVALATFVWGRSGGDGGARRSLQASARWLLATAWWFLVTKWCFGPAVIDRGFLWSGGSCEAEMQQVAAGTPDQETGVVLTAAACKAAGGRWRGGHDISGHVFMLVLGSGLLMQEAGWVLLLLGDRWRRRREAADREERAVVTSDGSVRGAETEAETETEPEAEADVDGGGGGGGLGLGVKAVLVVVALSLWMILMTAIYFHTWLEKLTGLLLALGALYSIYVLPRWVPPLRRVIGLPGI